MAKQFTSTILILTVKTYRLYPCPLLMSRSVKTRFELLYLYTTQATRKYCTDLNSNNDVCDNGKLNKKYTNLNKNIDASLVNTVSEILSISSNKALKICNDFHENKQLSKDDIINIITTVKKAGISVPMIRSNVLLFMQNIELLNQKIYYIKHISNDINEMLPLLKVDLKYLNILIFDEVHMDNKKETNKIKYLADELGCSVYGMCELIVNEPTIITLSFNRIKTVINLLKEYNYESKDILNSLWLFKYSPRTIRRRSSTVKLAGVNIAKTWMIRCSENLLQRYITTIKKEVKLHSVYGSHVDLLSKKLNITEEEVEFYIKRYPNILEVQLDKINDVLNVLLKYEYTAEDIFSCQRVFLLKVSLLEERLKRLQKVRGPHRLSLVYCSAKTFESVIKFANKIYNKKNT